MSYLLSLGEAGTRERKIRQVGLIVFAAITVATVHNLSNDRVVPSTLADKTDNLQYDLAYAKANFAADKIEVENSLARLKEMDKLLHASHGVDLGHQVAQLRAEAKVLLDKSSWYKTDSDLAEIKLDKALETKHSLGKEAMENLQNEQQDDRLFADILQRKAAKVEDKLKGSQEMALAMQRYRDRGQLVIGAMKEIDHLRSEKKTLEHDDAKLSAVLHEMSKRPVITALPDDKVEAAEREAMAIERLSRLKRRVGGA